MKVWIFTLFKFMCNRKTIFLVVSILTKEYSNIYCYISTALILFQYAILWSQLVCIMVLKFTGRVFLTRLWLLSDSGILIAFYYIYPLCLWRFLHRWFSPWNSFDGRFFLSLCHFSTCCHWNIFRNRSFLVFPIQFGCLYKLCSQHFSTLCKKDTIFKG